MSHQSKKNWVLPEEIPEKFKPVYEGIDETIARLLYNRGIRSKDDVKSFLSPDLKKIPSPNHLYDSTKAAKEILKAIKSKKRIYIHGDFDVDGICATAILWEFLFRELSEVIGVKTDIKPYIPDRVDEGYGLSEKSVMKMIDDGADLIITVDCGIRDRDLIDKIMTEHKVKFIITDHHQPPEDITQKLKYTIVHPAYPKHEYPFVNICGSTVSLLLVQQIKKHIKTVFPKAKALPVEIDENTPSLDIVALATVADIMPLTGMNRTLVKYGLEQIRKGDRVGLRLLFATAKVNHGLADSYHLGFVIGPRINAAGRIGSAIDALRLMVVRNEKLATDLSNTLHQLNIQRQDLTTEIIESAHKYVAINQDQKLYFIHGNGWPEGIIGLVAGKIQEEYGKPTVVTTDIHGEIRGSARSLPGFNITEAIEKFADNLDRYGGHAQAAGFTVKPDRLEKFRELLQAYAQEIIDPEKLRQQLFIDLLSDTSIINLKTADKLENLKPFGYENSKPIIMLPSVVIIDKKTLGKNGDHIKLVIKGQNLGTAEAILFNAKDDTELLNIDDVIDIAGTISINYWNNTESAQFEVREWRKSPTA